MDEVERITTGVMRLVVCDIFIPQFVLPRLEHTIVKES